MADFIADLFRALWIRILTSGVVVFGVVGVWQAPRVQEAIFPVIQPGSSQIIEHHTDEEGWTNIVLTFKKNYNCRAVNDATEWFFVDATGGTGVVAWQASVNSHTPAGVVVSPALRIQIPSEAKSFFARVLYNCGLPWQVYATIGPFPFPLT